MRIRFRVSDGRYFFDNVIGVRDMSGMRNVRLQNAVIQVNDYELFTMPNGERCMMLLDFGILNDGADLNVHGTPTNVM